MSNIYILSKAVSSGRFGIGRAKFIVNPPLPERQEDIVTALQHWMTTKVVLTIKSNVVDDENGTTTESNEMQYSLYGFHERKDAVQKIHHDLLAGLREKQKMARSAQQSAEQEKQRLAAAAEQERQRLASEQERQRLASEQEKQRLAAEQEKQRLSAEQEKQRLAAAAEQKKQKLAAAEQERQRLAAAAEQEKQRLAAEQEKQRLAAKQEKQRLAAQQEKQRFAAQQEKQRLSAEQEKQRLAAAAAIQEEQKLADAAEQEKQTYTVTASHPSDIARVVPASNLLFGSRALSFSDDTLVNVLLSDSEPVSSGLLFLTDENSSSSGGCKRTYRSMSSSSGVCSQNSSAFLGFQEESQESKIQRLECENYCLQQEVLNLKQQLGQPLLRDDNFHDLLAKKIADSVTAKLKDEFSAGAFKPPASASRSSASGSAMIPIADGYALTISKDNLNEVVNVGHVSGYDGTNTKKVLPEFVNRLLESVYSKKYMAEHSLTGNACPTKKRKKKKTQSSSALISSEATGEDAFAPADAVASTSSAASTTNGATAPLPADEPTKPSLPEEDVRAIIVFVTSCWNKWYKRDLDAFTIRKKITDKLATASRSYKAALAKAALATAAVDAAAAAISSVASPSLCS